jgi:hypothetical protein
MSTFTLNGNYADNAGVQLAMNQVPGAEAFTPLLEDAKGYLKFFDTPQEQQLEMLWLLERAGFTIVSTTSTFGAEQHKPVAGHWAVTFAG